MKNNLKKKLVTGLTALAIATGVTFSVPAEAALFEGDNSSLQRLIVLNELFSGGVFGGKEVVVQSGETLSDIAARELGDSSRFSEIAVLNGIADPDLIFPGQVLRIPDGNANGLGDLVVLKELFGDGEGIFDGENSSLEDLIVLDALFGNSNNGIFGGNVLGGDLNNLVILNELFGDGEGILDGEDSSLEDLIVLDALFGNSNNGMFNGNGLGGTNLKDLIILDLLFEK